MAATQIKTLRSWHESLIEWELLNPDKSQREAALYFSVSQSWLSQVINSDAYRARKEKVRAEHTARLSSSIIDKATAVAHMALDELTEQISTRELSAPKELRQTADLALRTLGYTARSGAPIPGVVNQQNNTVVLNGATPEDLAEARALLHQRRAPAQLEEQSPGTVIDATPARDGDGDVLPPAAKVSSGG